MEDANDNKMYKEDRMAFNLMGGEFSKYAEDAYYPFAENGAVTDPSSIDKVGLYLAERNIGGHFSGGDSRMWTDKKNGSFLVS